MAPGKERDIFKDAYRDLVRRRGTELTKEETDKLAELAKLTLKAAEESGHKYCPLVKCRTATSSARSFLTGLRAVTALVKTMSALFGQNGLHFVDVAGAQVLLVSELLAGAY